MIFKSINKGVYLILLAELCFSSSSVFAKLVVSDSEVSGIQITFFRFLMGTIIAFIMLKKTGQSFVPVNARMVTWRAIFNTISALLFFFSLKYTTVTNANMLGMTYPLWVVIFAPIILKETFEIKNIAFVILALIGVYLIVHPKFASFNIGDICAFGAGITASIAVLALRQARKYDTTYLIIFYLMLVGLIINSIILYPFWVNPSFDIWVLIMISAFLGFLAHIFITWGYKYVEATKGSLISSSRIIMAGCMGVAFFSDQITLQLIAGAILILSSQIAMIIKKLKESR